MILASEVPLWVGCWPKSEGQARHPEGCQGGLWGVSVLPKGSGGGG